jgi:hypothetical protein
MNDPSTFVTGQRVRLTYGDQQVDAGVLHASPDGASLMLVFDDILRTSQDGAFLGRMPLVRDQAGVYRDLFDGDVAVLEPIQEDAPTPTH